MGQGQLRRDSMGNTGSCRDIRTELEELRDRLGNRLDNRTIAAEYVKGSRDHLSSRGAVGVQGPASSS